jgi:hypothetical protein
MSEMFGGHGNYKCRASLKDGTSFELEKEKQQADLNFAAC